MDLEDLFRRLTRRYGSIEPDDLEAIMCPVLIPVATLDKTVTKLAGQNHYRASFSVDFNADYGQLLQPGRTGKFVPAEFNAGGPWREVAKGRLLAVNPADGIALGEVYTGGNRAALELALQQLTADDFWEVDQYGASAKVLSALVEHELARSLSAAGYTVRRMPEDTARHIGAYYYYDFEVERDGVMRRVEVKSLWGTQTRYARLIHSKSKTYPTSSCKFDTQDIFAVSLFLRTGSISEFAFARSVPRTESKPYGLPIAAKHPGHVHQNPLCEVGDGSWFASIDEVWKLP
jgi:hypothetical protein